MQRLEVSGVGIKRLSIIPVIVLGVCYWAHSLWG